MLTPCPHCHAEIEIDPETHASLAGQSHFACPACQAPVPVPSGARPRLKLNAAPGASAAMVGHQARRPTKSLSASKSRNRNLHILGSAALLVLGGIAFVLASKKSGDTHVTTQNIDNDIINNAYFQNLIAQGVTTRQDLLAVTGIRAYGDGFVGISKEAVAWESARDLAKRTGSEIMAIESGSGSPWQQLVEWLKTHFSSHLSTAVWVRQNSEPRVLEGSAVPAVTDMDHPRKVLLHWHGSTGTGDGAAAVNPRIHDDPWRLFDTSPLLFEHSLLENTTLDDLYCFGGHPS